MKATERQETTNQDNGDRQNHLSTVMHSWEGLWRHATLMDFKKGQVFFYRGHYPYGVFILVSGAANLLYEDAAGTKKTAPFPDAVPFGFDFISLGSEYPCTAVAQTDARVLFVPKTSLQNKQGNGSDSQKRL